MYPELNPFNPASGSNSSDPSIKVSHEDLPPNNPWDNSEAEEDTAVNNMPKRSIFEELSSILCAGLDWTQVQTRLPESWKWDVEFNSGCWTCTPMELDMPKHYPLKIARAPVVLPVEHQWPPVGGTNPPPDLRPSNPIACRAELPFDVVHDLFLTFEGSVGFYLLIN
jgi:hypothetical protein